MNTKRELFAMKNEERIYINFVARESELGNGKVLVSDEGLEQCRHALTVRLRILQVQCLSHKEVNFGNCDVMFRFKWKSMKPRLNMSRVCLNRGGKYLDATVELEAVSESRGKGLRAEDGTGA